MEYYKYTIGKYKFVLVGDKNGLSQLFIDNNTKPFAIDPSWDYSNKHLETIKIEMENFFIGKTKRFSIKLNPKGTEFQKKVWHALTQISYGKTYTYKQIAELIGNPKASRAVGMANNKNPIPILIPCHRVIGSSGKLVGYAFGLELKKELLNLERINLIFSELKKYYGSINRDDLGNGASWWPAKNPFEMMVGAILTQNTNWHNVEKAILNFKGNLTPEFIEKASLEKLAQIIKPSGYHNQKALKLKALCAWYKQYEYKACLIKQKEKMQIRDELLNIKGVGGETADSILVYAFGKTSFVIDAYTRRIFSRVGIEAPKDYDEFRVLIEKSIEENSKIYDCYHGLIVEHAKRFCTKTPNCKECPLKVNCEFGIRELENEEM